MTIAHDLHTVITRATDDSVGNRKVPHIRELINNDSAVSELFFRQSKSLYIDPEKAKRRGAYWDETMDWVSDEQFIKRLETDHAMANVVRKLVLLADALIPDAFRPANLELFDAAATQAAKFYKQQLYRNFVQSVYRGNGVTETE